MFKTLALKFYIDNSAKKLPYVSKQERRSVKIAKNKYFQIIYHEVPEKKI